MPLDLDPTERRVVGSLVEKQLSVPESYPMTLPALVAACNQKSNRDPETSLTEGEVQGALHALMDRAWVTRLELVGGRTVRYEHRMTEQLGVDPHEAALLAELLLRGPQSAPELKARASRMRPFGQVEEVERRLESLASRPVPYVACVGRRAGERVPRWEHLLGPRTAVPRAAGTPPAPVRPREPASATLEQRVAALEREVAALRARLEEK
jgi:uncharacterized protein YceH (UPF0502 family)